MDVRTMLSAANMAHLDKIDAELLLTCVLNIGRATLKAFPEREVTTEQKNQFKELMQRRLDGVPIAYLLGHKEFWSLDFLVTPDVLIPRPDTELLVEMALEQITQKQVMRVLDLGTGCGAIALSIASERHNTTVLATDISAEGKGMVELAIKSRKHKPMFMIDLAVPRDIEAQVRDISNVYLYCIDDLQAIATEHKQFRSSAAQKAKLIIDYEAEKFIKWLASQQANSTIQAFRQVCAIQKDLALSQALRELNSGKDAKQVLERFAHVLLNRLIHNPTVQMREASTSGNQELLEVVRELFKL